jgi:hypothetical protein
MSHAKKQRRKEERTKWNRIAIAASSRAAISFSSQPEAYQYQIATLSREESLTQRSQDAKKNAIKGTGWCDLREYISFSSQPEAYQDPIDFPTQRNEDAKG